METNRLKQFCAVAEVGNLRKAADLLCMSHSALSKSLKVLQSDLDLSLLTQVGRGIQITDEGKRFLTRARIFLDQEHILLEDQTKESNVIRIGTFEVFSSHLIGTCFAKYFNGSSLELAELLPGAIEIALEKNQIDFGITYEPIPHSEVEYLKICKIRMNAFKTKHAFKNLSFEEIPFAVPLIPINGSPTGAKGLDGWPANVSGRLVRYKVDMLESALALARNGNSAVFIPEFVARFHNMSVCEPKKLIPLNSNKFPLPKIERTVYIVRRKSSPENSKTEKTIAKLIRVECSQN